MKFLVSKIKTGTVAPNEALPSFQNQNMKKNNRYVYIYIFLHPAQPTNFNPYEKKSRICSSEFSCGFPSPKISGTWLEASMGPDGCLVAAFQWPLDPPNEKVTNIHWKMIKYVDNNILIKLGFCQVDPRMSICLDFTRVVMKNWKTQPVNLVFRSLVITCLPAWGRIPCQRFREMQPVVPDNLGEVQHG